MNTGTADELITDIRNLAALNNTGAAGAEDADVLLHINSALREIILPFLHNAREDYHIVRERFSTDINGRLRLPERAMWNKVSNLWWLDTQDIRRYLRPIPTEYLADYLQIGVNIPEGYYIEGNDIQLMPASQTGDVEVSYFFRPGDMVLTKDARQITSIDTLTGIVTFGTPVPSSWPSTPLFEVHSALSGAEIKVWDVAPTMAGSQGTFSLTDLDGSVFGRRAVVVGDWVCVKNSAALPAVPLEWHPLIVRAVALRYAEATGNTSMAQVHAGLLDRMLRSAEKTAEQRVEQKPLRLGQRRSALLAARRRRWYR